MSRGATDPPEQAYRFQEGSNCNRDRFPSSAGLILIVEQGYQTAPRASGAHGPAGQSLGAHSLGAHSLGAHSLGAHKPRCKGCCRSPHPPSRGRWAGQRSNQLRCGCGGAIG